MCVFHEANLPHPGSRNLHNSFEAAGIDCHWSRTDARMTAIAIRILFVYKSCNSRLRKEKAVKFLRANLTDQTIRSDAVPQACAGLGGRGLTSHLVAEEVPAGCDPLGKDNKLVFAPGYLSGTPLINTSRLSIGAKSPLTGGIKESNVGGTVAADLANLGITALIIEGRAPAGAKRRRFRK